MKRSTGIDIGSCNIKLIEIEDKKGHLSATRCAINQIFNGDVKTALKDLLALARLSLKRVNVSLSGPSVIVRYIEMPPMKRDELRNAIKFEADKYIPFNINETIIDYSMLDKTSSGSQRVVLAAVKKDEVEKLLELFRAFGLEIGAIDIDSFAFLNSFQRLWIDNKEENVCGLINIGARFSNMNIVIKQDVHFTRDIFWGGADITQRIKDSMGIGLNDAEALKFNPGEKRQEIASIITPVLERLASQIRISFDYFESQFGKCVEKFYISGGSAYLFNMVDFLKENLGIDVLMWNPFEGIAISEHLEEVERCPALFAVAIGLALRK